jgi:hypothetical protein
VRTSIWIAGAFAAIGCQSEGEQTEADAGVIQLAVAAAPQGTACLQVSVTGPSGGTNTRTFGLTPGTSTQGTLAGLPVGLVGVRAEAFDVACRNVSSTSTAKWVSEPVSVLLTAGAAVPLKLVMQKASQISVSVDWNSGGSGGSGAGGAGGAAGSGGSLFEVAQALNGKMLRAPCLLDAAATVCLTNVNACPAANPSDPALSGALLTDTSVTLGGAPGTPYTISLHVQGEVEAKRYTNGIEQENAAVSPRADGFYVGGIPFQGDAYGVYMIRVTNPGGSKTDYYLNSLVPPGVSDHTTYGIDYTAVIKAEGGASIRLVASDANCAETKNCGPTVNGGNVCAAPIVLPNVDPVAVSSNPSFNFQSPYNGQWISLVVSKVTSP